MDMIDWRVTSSWLFGICFSSCRIQDVQANKPHHAFWKKPHYLFMFFRHVKASSCSHAWATAGCRRGDTPELWKLPISHQNGAFKNFLPSGLAGAFSRLMPAVSKSGKASVPAGVGATWKTDSCFLFFPPWCLMVVICSEFGAAASHQ